MNRKASIAESGSAWSKVLDFEEGYHHLSLKTNTTRTSSKHNIKKYRDWLNITKDNFPRLLQNRHSHS